MAKGSVRKKGKKWYDRFYVEDESGNRIQKEFTGTESKSETESLLWKAMEAYEQNLLITGDNNITLSEMLDMYLEEELKVGSLSNGTIMTYQGTVKRIKKHPISKRKMRSITSEHLQEYIDFLCFGGTFPDGTVAKPQKLNSFRAYAAVLQNSFRFAVFPKKIIAFNPMQYVVRHVEHDDYEIFSEDKNIENNSVRLIIDHKQYTDITDFLYKKKNPALLPMQIAYYIGLRISEVCGLTWQDVDFENQQLTIRRSMRYNYVRKATELGPTKRKKIRVVDFCDTLACILNKAKKEQEKEREECGVLYFQNAYKEVKEKNRVYFEIYSKMIMDGIINKENLIDFVCLRHDGSFESTSAVSIMCRTARDKVKGLGDFHFHTLRHTYTSNLLSLGAAVKDVQELLEHSDVTTTMNIYAHSSKEAKVTSARLLDKINGGK